MTKSFFRDFKYNPPLSSVLPIVYQDNDVLVLNKPAGLLSVEGKTPDLEDCLESRVVERFSSATIVHRLDMSTSGVIVMALNSKSHSHISLQFEKRKTSKTYIALIWGHLQQQKGRVDLPLKCDWPNRPRQMVDHELGRPSQTDWEVMGYEGNFTRVKLFPLTGRSHQLRVHMLELGHPILGDEFYAHDEAYYAADRLQLHAQCLEIYHPVSGERMVFEAVCPF